MTLLAPPTGHVLFLDGPVQLSLGPASEEELFRALDNVNRLADIAVPMLATRFRVQQSNAKEVQE